MGYDRGDRFPFDFEPNGIPFGSKSKEKLFPRSYPIQFERKWNTSFLSAGNTAEHDLLFTRPQNYYTNILIIEFRFANFRFQLFYDSLPV